jgi:hypothetical protein
MILYRLFRLLFCPHKWAMYRATELREVGLEYPVGYAEFQRCTRCGNLRKQEFIYG